MFCEESYLVDPYWEACAEYANGTTINSRFEYRETESAEDQQYALECWLANKHPDITWMSVVLTSYHLSSD